MKISALVFLIFLAGSASAQDEPANTNKRKIQYFNQFTSGVLSGKGDLGTTVSVSTVHGISINRLRAGLGIGYDNYATWSAVPFTAVVSYDLFKVRDNYISLQLSGGPVKLYKKEVNDGYRYSDFSGSVLMPQIMYRVQTNKLNIYIAAGYKWQKMNYKYQPAWIIFNDASRGPVTSVERMMERFSLTVGFGMN